MAMNGISATGMHFAATTQVSTKSGSAALETRINDTVDRRKGLKALMAGVKSVHESLNKVRDLLSGGNARAGGSKTKVSSRVAISSETSDRIADIPELGGVTAGNVLINGVAVSVDPNDSIMDFINRVNQSKTGAYASFNTSTRQVVIRSAKRGQSVDLDDDSDFLAGLGIDDGVHSPGKSNQTTRRLLEQDEVKKALAEMTESLNALFKTTYDGAADETDGVQDKLYGRVRTSIYNMIGSPLMKGGKVFTDLGFVFEHQDQSKGLIQFKVGEFSDAARTNGDELLGFLMQDLDGVSQDGFLTSLNDSLDDVEKTLKSELGSTAVFLSRWM